jgi:hypothetical protein
MDFKKHLETAWHLTLKFIAPLIFMTLVTACASFLTLGILAPVSAAGYIQSILLMFREGREPKIQDVFSRMDLFLPLLAFEVIAVIATAVGLSLLVLPGVLISLAIAFGCLYMLPLMTDRNMKLMDALKESFSMSFQGNTADHFVVTLLVIGISWIGVNTVIGWLFTQPMATIFLVSVYEERIRRIPDFPSDDQPLVQK